MKQLTLATLIIAASALFLAGCTGEQGPAGPTGPTGPTGATGATGNPGPEAVYYNFNLDFNASTTMQTYDLTPTIFDGNDAVLVYLRHPSYPVYDEWVLLPWVWYNPGYVPVQFWSSIDRTYKTLWLYTTRADNNTGSPWASTYTAYYKAVVIKASAGKSTPIIDYSNYKEVKEYFNFDD